MYNIDNYEIVDSEKTNKLGYNYDESLNNAKKANDALELARSNGKISDKEYIEMKTHITNIFSESVERKIEQEDIYNSITNDKDKQKYDTYRKINSGTFDDSDHLINEDGVLWYDAPKQGQLMTNFNTFYMVDGEVKNTKTVEMGKILYNKILKSAKDLNINIENLNIKSNGGNHSFDIPHNKKSFIEFSKIYNHAIKNTFLNGAFVNTANKQWLLRTPQYRSGEIGSGRIDGNILNSTANIINYYTEEYNRIQQDYGVGKYYRPIISPYEEDITVDFMREMGFKQEDINEQRKYISKRVKSPNFLGYRIYGNIEDISKNNDGGVGALTEITDTEIKKQIQDAITSGYADNKKDTGANVSEMQYSFATKGGVYGTMITIPKGHGTYKVFVENLLPSAAADEYVRQPDFQTRVALDEWAAINNKNRIRRNDIGESYSGSFKAYDDNFYYKTDDNENYTELSREEAHVLKLYSDMYRHYCLQNALSKEINENNNEEIRKFLTTPHRNGYSFIDVLKKVSGRKSDEVIIEELIDTFNNYYKLE